MMGPIVVMVILSWLPVSVVKGRLGQIEKGDSVGVFAGEIGRKVEILGKELEIGRAMRLGRGDEGILLCTLSTSGGMDRTSVSDRAMRAERSRIRRSMLLAADWASFEGNERQ